MNNVLNRFQGTGLMSRVLRGGTWLVLGYGGQQALRLAANLILTRLLFPEAFGLMTLINVILIGLAMFSDIGLHAAIAQNARGDDQKFLDTAWTIQVGRGTLLWLCTCALAWPMAQFYNEPDLAFFLPIAGLSMLIAGFNTTKIETAHRHLMVGRVTVLDLLSQLTGLIGMVGLAYATQSVIALVCGGIIQSTARLVLTWLLLPGHQNRFHWEPRAARDLIQFGKWLFLSTLCWFFASQGDRIILGKFLPLETLGLYNIGYFMASFPLLLAQNVNGRLMIPVYRDKPASASKENFLQHRKLRSGITAGLLCLSMILAFAGPGLVDFLYDDRYAMSGAMVTLLSCLLMPGLIVLTYDQAALAAGDSKSYFVYSAARAGAQIGFVWLGIAQFGLIGAIFGMGLASVATYPFTIWISRRHSVWDPLHDLVFASLTIIPSALALWVHWDRVSALIANG